MDEILPDLFRHVCRLPGPQQPVNTYLWRRPGGGVLIDPAADASAAEFPGRISDIFVTHFQAENVEGAANFRDATLHIPAGDAYLAAGLDAYLRTDIEWRAPWDWETRGNFQGHLAGARNERPTREPLAAFKTVTPPATLFGGEVVSTPGHGKHAMTLIATISGKRVSFCGDLIFGQGHLWNWFDSDWDYGLETGQRTLLESVRRLRSENLDALCPTHGPVIWNPAEALALLEQRLARVINTSKYVPEDSINFPEQDSPAKGFRQILPQIHQWRAGNCNVLLSSSGNALMVDDGLCNWVPEPERARFHRSVIADVKRTLGVRKIEVIIPTHFHGDHTENITEAAELEGAEVVCVDSVAEPMEHPERFNLSAPLPWYGAVSKTLRIDRKVKSGDHFRWREFEIELFHLGGQTYYHLGAALKVDGLRVMFVGDGMHLSSRETDPVLCYNDAEPAERGWSYSLDRMAERSPDLLVCGHGSAVRDPMPIIEHKRLLWRQRLQQFAQLNPRTTPREFFDPFLK